MLDRANSGFNRRSGVFARMPGTFIALSASGPVDFLLSKAEFEAGIFLSWDSPAAVLHGEGTGLADLGIKAGDVTGGATWFYRHFLSIGAGQCVGFSLLIRAENKLGQTQFVFSRRLATDTRLEQLNFMLVQLLISSRASISAISI